MDWRLLQLADSAFPTGGFVHSGGIESSFQLGVLTREGLGSWLADAVQQQARSVLPLVVAAFRAPERVLYWDALAEAWLVNHVANRASRAQGQAWLSTCAGVFPEVGIGELRKSVRAAASPGHLAPVYGVIATRLGMSETEARHLYLFLQLRGLVSSAVRLSLCGPIEAQRLQAGLGPVLNAAAAIPADDPEDCATTLPLAELAQAHHDRLYSRLFST